MGIRKDSPMNQATEVNMLNGPIYIFIDITSIKFQFCVNKVLHNISNKACLQIIKEGPYILQKQLVIWN